MLPSLTVLLFVTAVGACIGSLTNVLVYRIPLGLDVVTPTSRCTKCNHKLTWRENIPIFGWLILRGKCRFCKCKISPEYPIVETIVALLFGGIYALWYIVPKDAIWGLGKIAPEWAENGATLTWPSMVVLLVLVASLVSMTIIDARTSTIPLVLTWVPALVALVFHTGHAIWFQSKYGTPVPMPLLPGFADVPSGHFKWITAPGEIWTIATGGLGGWRFIGVGIGGMVGLILSNLFLKLGWLTRSFEDFEQWYESHHKSTGTSDDEPVSEDQTQEQAPDTVEDWLMYPHARREMIRELAFLCLPVLLGLAGGWVAVRMGGQWSIDPISGHAIPSVNAPLWLVVLGAVLMGYLIAGGVVWAVRIGGTLAFGKEAMGLGDVHMMAAVGACLGWIDPTIAFFLAAFVGVAYAIVAQVFRGKLSRAMPYGPFLAVATMMVVLGKPLVEWGLGRIFGMSGPMSLP
jgi:leader peptidase (prepilin peptidase) / N-methyltransferase